MASENPSQAFWRLVREALAKTKNTKWGSEESLHVQMGMIEWLTGDDSFRKDEEFVKAIKFPINPSQFAQALEGMDDEAAEKVNNQFPKMLNRLGRGERSKQTLSSFGKK